MRKLSAALLLAACLGAPGARADGAGSPISPFPDAPARAPMGDIAYGDPDAKVTVVEYASMTCPHCAAFTDAVWPRIKKDYVDTGKVRWVYRDLAAGDPFAIAESMLLRCTAPRERKAALAAFYRAQPDFLASSQPAVLLLALAKQYGVDDAAAKSCMADKSVFDAINADRAKASGLGIANTPTFVVGGHVIKGAKPYEFFALALGEAGVK